MPTQDEALGQLQHLPKELVRTAAHAQVHQEPVSLHGLDHAKVAKVAIDARVGCLHQHQFAIHLGALHQSGEERGEAHLLRRRRSRRARWSFHGWLVTLLVFRLSGIGVEVALRQRRGLDDLAHEHVLELGDHLGCRDPGADQRHQVVAEEGIRVRAVQVHDQGCPAVARLL